MHAVSNEPLLDEFEEHLRQQGYKRKSIQLARPSCRRFLAYLKQHGLPLEQVTPDILDTYLTAQLHLFQQRHQRLPPGSTPWRHQFTYGIPGFLRYTFGQWPPKPMPTSGREAFYDQLAHDYAQWLGDVRGLSPQTITDLQAEAKRFLDWLLRLEPDGILSDLSVAQVDAWLTYRLADKRRPTKVRLVYALRSFLRWLHHQAFTARDLAAVVTTPSQYALEHLPSALSREEIDRVLEQTRHDQTPKGLRDFAILTLLAIYGLRAGEIATLRLENVDWRGQRLLIQHRKTGKETVLPLLAQAGEAILAYLRRGRPQTSAREIFIRAKAPHQPFRDGSSLYALVDRRLQRAGIEPKGKRGPHAFRHAHALRLMRHGVPLKTIGDVLGHQAPTSTTIYLRLAMEDLRTVALEIPVTLEAQ
jgi:site-specific recombinase XerD